MLQWLKRSALGLGLCVVLSVPAQLLGNRYRIVGGAVFAILLGLVVGPLIAPWRGRLEAGIRVTSKKVLQWAVVLLGFGMHLGEVVKTGVQSLPIILSTIGISLILAWLVSRWMKIPRRTATLVGVGSSICGGSAIAATAPVIEADDGEVAQAISVIFLFNVLAALIFPAMGTLLGFSTVDGTAFGIFSGTAVNDTSSVTACAASWDSMHNLGSATLDKAVTVKLTRTLAIVPIVLGLIFLKVRAVRTAGGAGAAPSARGVFPMFILYFVLASVVTTVAFGYGPRLGMTAEAMKQWFFGPMKALAKYFIVLAMAAIGLNTNLIRLIRTGGKPLLLGAICWVGIILTSLGIQLLLARVVGVQGIW